MGDSNPSIDFAKIVNLLLPLWGTLLLSIGWLNRGSRAALLGELTSWVMTLPLTLTLLLSIKTRTKAFRITPKHSTFQGLWG